MGGEAALLLLCLLLRRPLPLLLLLLLYAGGWCSVSPGPVDSSRHPHTPEGGAASHPTRWAEGGGAERGGYWQAVVV
jgi:hypothetical protein